MKKLLLFTALFSGCYNNHYYPDTEEPVGSGGGVEVNVDQQQPQHLEVPARADDLPRPKQTPPPKAKKKYRKCEKWSD